MQKIDPREAVRQASLVQLRKLSSLLNQYCLNTAVDTVMRSALMQSCFIPVALSDWRQLSDLPLDAHSRFVRAGRGATEVYESQHGLPAIRLATHHPCGEAISWTATHGPRCKSTCLGDGRAEWVVLEPTMLYSNADVSEAMYEYLGGPIEWFPY